MFAFSKILSLKQIGSDWTDHPVKLPLFCHELFIYFLFYNQFL
jgi:hypothetical protein